MVSNRCAQATLVLAVDDNPIRWTESVNYFAVSLDGVGLRCPRFAPVSDASFACELRMLPRPTIYTDCVDAAGLPGFECMAAGNAFGALRVRFFGTVLEIPGFGGSFGCGRVPLVSLNNISTIAFGE